METFIFFNVGLCAASLMIAAVTAYPATLTEKIIHRIMLGTMVVTFVLALGGAMCNVWNPL